ncbi:hypothetical protein ACP275_07G070200 [Erythranthe tilingii]
MDCRSEEDAFLFATQLAMAAVFPAALKTAVELDLFELIKKSGSGAAVSARELAAQLPAAANPDAHVMLDRILRLLTSYSVLNSSPRNLPHGGGGGVELVYSLAPVCKYLTKNEDGVSVSPFLLLIQDQVLQKSWDNLKDAVLDGGVPFAKAYGMNVFEYGDTDPRFNKVFDQAMSNYSTIVVKKILEIYDGFEGIKSVVDVGGGTGAILNMIVSKYPSIKGINFDLPHVIQHAPSYPGVEHIGGDMFVSVPKGDAIFMKWIVHDWNDEQCLILLKNCYSSLQENGKVILAELIMPEEPDKSVATKTVLHSDVLMLTHNPGGRERTEKEFHTLAKAAGFREFRKVCSPHNIWIMELVK